MSAAMPAARSAAGKIIDSRLAQTPLWPARGSAVLSHA